ncbi:MAG: VanZ family protein [Chitinophagales bacterium]
MKPTSYIPILFIIRLFNYIVTISNFSMEKREKAMRVVAWIGMLFCLLVLSKYILFKKGPRFYKSHFRRDYKGYTVREGWENANITPFHTIRLFSSRRVSSEYSYQNIGGNIVGFIPLGILLPLVFSFLTNGVRLAGFVFGISLLFETIQLITGVGIFDVDDLLLNTAGGLIGYILYAGARYLVREEPG